MVVVIDSQDQAQGDDGDNDLAKSADDEWACSLLEEVAKVGAESDSGEGQEKRPAAEIAQNYELSFAEAEMSDRGIRVAAQGGE